MGAKTTISWTDRTFNPWWGCTKIGPGCDACYAAAFDHRLGGNHWGAGAPRRYFGDKHWNEPRNWDRKAAKHGVRYMVFCASMADVFDNEVDQEHRERLWALIRETPNLEWQIVTKRAGNIAKMLPADWGAGYPNVWLIITVVNQEEADRDIPKFIDIPAAVHGLSIEPMIGHVDLARWGSRINWVICGGESRQRPHVPRSMPLDWPMELATHCAFNAIAFHMKQLSQADYPYTFDLFSTFPAAIQVRQFPVRGMTTPTDLDALLRDATPLVERLRAYESLIMRQAADTIEALRAEVERLTVERDGERQARENTGRALRQKDEAMGVLLDRCRLAGVDLSDLFS